MQTPEQVSEARRALADNLTHQAICDWIREDTPFAVKMTVMPKHVAALVRRLAALRADPARATEEMRELPRSDFRQGRTVPRNVYHGDEPLFMAATDELANELVQILNAGAAAIRALPIQGDGMLSASPSSDSIDGA